MIGRRALVWVAALLLIGLAGVGGFLIGSGGHQAGATPECPAVPTIVIDPGHGGVDGGANRPGMLEKEIVLDIALQTRHYLDRQQVPVVLTRTEDVDLGGAHDGGRLRRDLNYRIRTANQCQTVLMLSLHVNSTSDPTERGMMIFHQPSRPSRDAAWFFDQILRGNGLHDRQERPYYRTNLAILKTKAPSLLIELGFITNDQDQQLLADSAYRDKVAQALATGCTAIYHQWIKQGVR